MTSTALYALLFAVRIAVVTPDRQGLVDGDVNQLVFEDLVVNAKSNGRKTDVLDA